MLEVCILQQGRTARTERELVFSFSLKQSLPEHAQLNLMGAVELYKLEECHFGQEAAFYRPSHKFSLSADGYESSTYV